MRDRAQLLARIAAEPRLARLLEAVRGRASPDPGHDLAHFLRVALWTVRLGGAEVPEAEAVAAALLHDIVNVPKDSPERARASELCGDEAARLLPALGFAADEVERIREAIVDHSFSRGATPRSPLGCALQDADRLEALGVIGTFRTISTGVQLGADYFDPHDPWALGRPLDDQRHSVDHFFVKLFRLAGSMNTAAGRAEALRRSQRMHTLLGWLGEEIGEPAPASPGLS